MIGAPAFGATLTVTNTNDSGAGSLRAAITAAAPGDTIVFAPAATGTIALASVLAIAQSVTIQGPGVTNLVLDGQTTVQVIDISAGSVNLSGVTIANGKTAGLGAGVRIAGGASLTVSNSRFFNNEANDGGGISNTAGATLSVNECTFDTNRALSFGGGGIINFGIATVNNSTFDGNTAPINGGAINVQGTGTLTLINDTFFNNASNSLGGAVSSLGTVTAINVTFAGNQGTPGSAIATANANLAIYNNVFADNVAGGAPGALYTGGAPVSSNNVFYNNTAGGPADDGTGYGTSNFIAAAAEPLNALGNNGGPTQTMLPVTAGDAVCAGSVALLPGGLSRDQRNFTRTTLGGTCVDGGAVQLGGMPISSSPPHPVPALSTWLLVLLGGSLAMLGVRRLKVAR